MKINKVWATVLVTTSILLILEISMIYKYKHVVRNSLQELKKETNIVEFSPMIEPRDFQFELPKSLNSEPDKYQPHVKKELVSFPKFSETISEVRDGWNIVNNPDSELVVLNKQRKLPENFVPDQLIIPDIRFPSSYGNEKKLMQAVAALALEKMFNQAENEGIILYGISAYRSYERQIAVHNQHIKSKGEKRAKEVSAVPGSSEHQTGLSLDVSSERHNFKLTTDFGISEEGIWIANNAHKFGFIIRYLDGKTDITGYSYEPWHIRYIGNPFATYLFENNLTLEEAINQH